MTIEEDEDNPTPEDVERENQLREAEQTRRDLEQQGWQWRGESAISKELCHPDDPDVNIWFDPYTGEQFPSPKMAARIREQLQRDRDQGVLTDPK